MGFDILRKGNEGMIVLDPMPPFIGKRIDTWQQMGGESLKTTESQPHVRVKNVPEHDSNMRARFREGRAFESGKLIRARVYPTCARL